MNQTDMHKELPDHYEELKAAANRTSDWRARLKAVEELGKWKHSKTIDVLTHRMTNDAVFPVREAAYRKLKQLGEAVNMPAKPKGELVKGVNKLFVRIKKSLPEGHTYEEFKEKLKNMRIDVYDTYEGNMGDEFDGWLKSTWTSL